MSFSMTGAFKEIQATPVQRLVAYMLADAHNHQTGRCDLSVASLVRLTSLSERTVRAALGELEKAGHITRLFRRGTSTQYRLHPRKCCVLPPAEDAPRSLLPSASGAPGHRRRCTPPLRELHLPPAAAAPKPEGTRNELTMNLCRLAATEEVSVGEDDAEEPESETKDEASSPMDSLPGEFTRRAAGSGGGNAATGGVCEGDP